MSDEYFKVDGPPQTGTGRTYTKAFALMIRLPVTFKISGEIKAEKKADVCINYKGQDYLFTQEEFLEKLGI